MLKKFVTVSKKYIKFFSIQQHDTCQYLSCIFIYKYSYKHLHEIPFKKKSKSIY
ncbi:hypothetical protein AHAS_Ahas04G0074900 [Arachis hypogaea]